MNINMINMIFQHVKYDSVTHFPWANSLQNPKRIKTYPTISNYFSYNKLNNF